MPAMFQTNSNGSLNAQPWQNWFNTTFSVPSNAWSIKKINIAKKGNLVWVTGYLSSSNHMSNTLSNAALCTNLVSSTLVPTWCTNVLGQFLTSSSCQLTVRFIRSSMCPSSKRLYLHMFNLFQMPSLLYWKKRPLQHPIRYYTLAFVKLVMLLFCMPVCSGVLHQQLGRLGRICIIYLSWLLRHHSSEDAAALGHTATQAGRDVMTAHHWALSPFMLLHLGP